MLPQFENSPFRIQLSFHRIIERLEQTAANDAGWRGKNAVALLKKVALHPELRDGFTTQEQIAENKELIEELLADLFPEALTTNEIKAVSLPYQGILFNKTQRFENILRDAGPAFDINIRDFDDHQFYVLSCCMILFMFYGTQLDFKKPLFYDIPNADGIVKHYRILYNGDFLEVIPAAGEIPVLTQAEINELMDSYDNLALWKEKFPPGTWIIKGFALMSLVDVTVENSLSTLKSNLLGSFSAQQVRESLISIFRSMFGIPDMLMGFTLFDQNEGKFGNGTAGLEIKSFLVPVIDEEMDDCKGLLQGGPYKCVIQDHTYFAVSDVDEFIKQNPGNKIGPHFKEQGAQSFILAPVIKNDILLGILELVSPRKRELNTVTANKLEIVMPFLIDTIDRKRNEMQNKVQAVIQNHYTTLHPSVYWKFRREALNYIHSDNAGIVYPLKEVTFKDVYPLYGQVDISASSATRNTCVQNDLSDQLTQLIILLGDINVDDKDILITSLRGFISEVTFNFKADTEQQIQHYLETKIHPVLHLHDDEAVIATYFKNTEATHGAFHKGRRDYDKTLTLINQKLTSVLDARQAEIQRFYPHYFERFKTDGVEHNMYIGSSISPKHEFSKEHLHRLRLWQLRVIVEMETEQFDLKGVLPYPLGVTSLILAFSTPIAIRFRMDEKHFDVDGAYNIRYEVIKKRIDKANIKGTVNRVTQQGKITIIYSKAEDEQEYMRYISILQQEGVLESDVEHFDVEDLQSVSGLKALRVGIIHQQNLLAQRSASYNDLYKKLD